MANYLTTDTELTSIANAIRTKGGTSAQLTYPTGFVTAINAIPTGGGGGTINVILSGDQSYGCAYGLSRELMQNSNLRSSLNITTENLIDVNNMFMQLRGVSTIGFNLNFADTTININNIFNGCYNLTSLPTFNWGSSGTPLGTCFGIFMDCSSLTQIPDIFSSVNNLESFHDGTGNLNTWFSGCRSVVTISSDLLSKIYNKSTGNQTFRQMFDSCYCLQRINNFGVFHPTQTVSRNIFSTKTFYICSSLTSLTFAANGAARNYSNQTIDLTNSVGYTTVDWGYPVTGGSTLADSVYNHASAVETINSLPDCSAVSPPASPTNVIKFAAGSGANTAGGNISDLTAAEIAVATNKGWDVQFVTV